MLMTASIYINLYQLKCQDSVYYNSNCVWVKEESHIHLEWLKGELRHKMNLWSNKTLVPSRPFSDIWFHDNRI